MPFLLSIVFSSLGFAQQQSPTPELPPDIPKDAIIRMFVTDKTPAGQDAVWTTPDGVIHEFFQFNDRGRGPKSYSSYKVDAKGILTFQETKGVDYMKSPVDERFAMTAGQASWKNESENDKSSNATGKFFVSLDAGPEATVLLVEALLKNGGKLDLLPGGEAKIQKVDSLSVEAAGTKIKRQPV